MMIHDLMKKPLPHIPSEIANALHKNIITSTPFGMKNNILSDADLQGEVGYRQMEDGTFLVSMVCPMPGMTAEMISWWFWWHPQASERYQVWYPGAHYGISYARRNRDYFTQNTHPDFRSNTQYPIERIGDIIMPLRIDFVRPETFGFSREMMIRNDIPLIVCGHVGAFGGLLWHTEMAHIFKKTDEGLLLISRFWIGQTLKNPILRRLILTDKTARGMSEHCCIEYRNLVQILPLLYEQNSAAKA